MHPNPDHPDTPGPESLDELADIEAGSDRMANARHFRGMARQWRDDRRTIAALRDALLRATEPRARARRARVN